MRIALTGASSFTGMWFAQALAESGHEVVVFLRRKKQEYEGLKKKRIEKIASLVQVVDKSLFGSEPFFSALEKLPSLDLFCHHAAVVKNYKSPLFPYVLALEQNTKGVEKLLSLLEGKGCRHLVLSGSIFERGEGKGSDLLRAVSPYGLSKTLTCEVFRYHCQEKGFFLGKFVIPNPFGPYEERRFCYSLMNCWLAGKTAVVSCPDYIRDNVPVQLLSACYASFCERFAKGKETFEKINPSLFAMSQRAFTSLFQEEMRKRLLGPCDVQFLEQISFLEPLERVNTDKVDFKGFGLEEEDIWDEIAAYYQKSLIPSL